MNKHSRLLLLICLIVQLATGFAQSNVSDYLADVKTELKKEWPKNRVVNLVFHGHSVPAGYFKTPVVNTFDSYPFLAFKRIKELYPNAVVNVIITAKGGENSTNGQKRFKKEVLVHKPDVLFIDYALNDRMTGLEKSRKAMEKMIKAALKKKIKVILLTPTPHQNYNLLDTTNAYEPFAQEVRDLAKEYKVGLVDSYETFREELNKGHKVTEFMSQVNHPNKEGHQLVADKIVAWFE
ncbi:SGNH/GDSL hydrolase family protein [Flavisolibacter ginsenosidimutans]|uniref:SGNH/GDSL hydrolase family protein n=1 Tax=Flavisolibacter ginsenosidimutans TaxID=661481 RepID=A0A5B8UE56_9BACT|nr:GDSL-type esterase/lipase family protein [Flavisolibacter ginsenosidimutans]QEC54370.1 SGNH/GDSL hydrolase family protein [Flavisolibacter ginsenosidimutans]